MYALAATALAALALLPGAMAASFDCAKATSRVERLLCDDKALGAQDEQLAERYAALLDALPRGEVRSARDAQRAWLAQRNACLQQAAVAACVQRTQQARLHQFDPLDAAAAARLDRIIAGIPAAPAAAAAQLRDYDGPLASAWLAYLQRFVPAAGVAAGEARSRFAGASAALRKQDTFAASLLDDTANDKAAPAGMAELTLLRMWIERNYGDDARPYVHCFVFERQGALAYDAMGPLYGSTRDGSAPVCAPQGDLFRQPAWKQLRAAIEPTEQQYGMDAGTIRFATFADWRVIELRATVSPLLYLQPQLRKRYSGDAASAIDDWSGEGAGDEGRDIAWPDSQRKRALALLPQVRQATASWLQGDKRLAPAQAAQAAAAIVDVWVVAHLQGP
ncbi:DUF1311 domain-containing protein [Xanthomonas sp. AmX2]|nr:DUF1311 domain-containing protein [Xanthomonas sp.]